MKQYTLSEAYNGYPLGQVFQGPYPARSQSNKLYVPIEALPGPEGTDMGLFASFVEASQLFTEVTKENPPVDTGGLKEPTK